MEAGIVQKWGFDYVRNLATGKRADETLCPLDEAVVIGFLRPVPAASDVLLAKLRCEYLWCLSVRCFV